jgi:hypothetical protein
MYPAEINTQLAQQHIADLHATARDARLAAAVRRPRRSFVELLQQRLTPRTAPGVTARPACTEAN